MYAINYLVKHGESNDPIEGGWLYYKSGWLSCLPFRANVYIWRVMLSGLTPLKSCFITIQYHFRNVYFCTVSKEHNRHRYILVVRWQCLFGNSYYYVGFFNVNIKFPFPLGIYSRRHRNLLHWIFKWCLSKLYYWGSCIIAYVECLRIFMFDIRFKDTLLENFQDS